jgi:hypothetical protein
VYKLLIFPNSFLKPQLRLLRQCQAFPVHESTCRINPSNNNILVWRTCKINIPSNSIRRSSSNSSTPNLDLLVKDMSLPGISNLSSKICTNRSIPIQIIQSMEAEWSRLRIRWLAYQARTAAVVLLHQISNGEADQRR